MRGARRNIPSRNTRSRNKGQKKQKDRKKKKKKKKKKKTKTKKNKKKKKQKKQKKKDYKDRPGGGVSAGNWQGRMLPSSFVKLCALREHLLQRNSLRSSTKL